MATRHASDVVHVTGFVASATITIDLATKFVSALAVGPRSSGLIIPVSNHDFSLGLGRAPLPIMVILMAVVAVAVGWHLIGETIRRQVPAWVTGLVIGGAVANLVDRIMTGSVHDFIATPWLIFNIADIAIVAGIIGWATTRQSQPWPLNDKEVTP